MSYVYALKSTIKDWIYVGITSNLERRLKQHNAKQNKSTKHYAPFDLVYSEELEIDHLQENVRNISNLVLANVG